MRAGRRIRRDSPDSLHATGRAVMTTGETRRMTPRKLYRIGEVMRYSGLSRQTVHNYTMMGLIREAERTESGHRLYDEEVFERIERINKLKRHKTLKEVREIIEKEDALRRKDAERK
jgi:hypothetical protein